MNFIELKRKTMDYLMTVNIGEKVGMFDKEMGPILTAINAEPHVFTFQSCYGHYESEAAKYLDSFCGGEGHLWLAFDGEIPIDCPFPNTILKDREVVPILEIIMRKRSMVDWMLLLKWIRSVEDRNSAPSTERC